MGFFYENSEGDDCDNGKHSMIQSYTLGVYGYNVYHGYTSYRPAGDVTFLDTLEDTNLHIGMACRVNNLFHSWDPKPYSLYYREFLSVTPCMQQLHTLYIKLSELQTKNQDENMT